MSVFVSPPGRRGRDLFSKLLLTGDALADTSTYARTITNAGVTVADAASYYPNLAAACYFDGGSSLSVADDSSLEFGSQDFTIELLVSHFASPSLGMAYISKAQANALSWVFGMYSTTSIGFWHSTNGTGLAYDGWSWTPTIGVTYRVVFIKSGTTIRCYVNGNKLGSDLSVSSALLDTSAPLMIGSYYYPASIRGLTGCLSDLRISIGTNRGYTGDTIPVPTSPLQADAYTRLLIPMRTPGGAFVDASGTGKIVTTSGTPAMAYLPVEGKALNFSSAYLSLPDNADYHLAADAETDFTIDAWCKGSGCICSLFDGTNGWAVILYGNSYGLTFSYGNALATYLPSNDTPNTAVWNHCAVVRRNGTLFIYRNGALKASGTLGAVTLPSTMFRVGAYSWSGSYSYFAGQIANLRVTKGLARWTRDFTPPTLPY